MKEWLCINRDGAATGIVKADTPDEAALSCAKMWAESGCYDVDHVHDLTEKQPDLEATCKHCAEIRARQAKEVKH